MVDTVLGYLMWMLCVYFGMLLILMLMIYLGGGCCVDIVEESLEIIAGQGTVHLLAGP